MMVEERWGIEDKMTQGSLTRVHIDNADVSYDIAVDRSITTRTWNLVRRGQDEMRFLSDLFEYDEVDRWMRAE